VQFEFVPGGNPFRSVGELVESQKLPTGFEPIADHFPRWAQDIGEGETLGVIHAVA